jgi:hypothetical protein
MGLCNLALVGLMLRVRFRAKVIALPAADDDDDDDDLLKYSLWEINCMVKAILSKNVFVIH